MMTSSLPLTFLLYACLLLQTSVAQAEPDDRGRSEIGSPVLVPVSVYEEYDEIDWSSETCTLKTVWLEGMDPILPQEKRIIEIKMYHPIQDDADLGSVIIMPPTGFATPFDHGNAYRFCRSGLVTALVNRWKYQYSPGTDWKNYDLDSVRSIAAAQQTIDYVLQLRPNRPIGIMGTSVGALTASGILSIDDRVTAGILLVGGGPLHEILAKTTLAREVELRKKRKQEFNLRDDQEYEEVLTSKIEVDTISYAQEARKKGKSPKLWMFVSTEDKTVPTDTQFKLWEAWGRPRIDKVWGNHVSGIVLANILFKHRIRDFFVQNLRASPQPELPNPVIRQNTAYPVE